MKISSERDISAHSAQIVNFVNMAKFVPDIKSNRWVVIAPARVTRPHDNSTTPTAPRGECPFCPGQEDLNKTVFSVGNIRVIANKYPITDFHEVIIHSPDHNKDIDDLPIDQIELLLNVYRQRFNYHKNNGQVMIFNNHDIHAGASLKHPHSQIVVVPKQINLDDIAKEPVQNEVLRTKNFIAYCPDFSQWPYEIWLAPLEEKKFFGEITDDQIKDLAPLVQKILAFIHKKFSGDHPDMKQPMDEKDQTGDVPYNYYIYHGQDWYLRIVPRLIHRAGFELGTGLSVNIIDPTEAAKEYRDGINSVTQ
ncbi:DUF4931 domain-containing protein [Candidatus Microgenomates bacterium]|nr:DUF4931 domain-containing protein [Candidatus Microgenomates bacterium]